MRVEGVEGVVAFSKSACGILVCGDLSTPLLWTFSLKGLVSRSTLSIMLFRPFALNRTSLSENWTGRGVRSEFGETRLPGITTADGSEARTANNFSGESQI